MPISQAEYLAMLERTTKIPRKAPPGEPVKEVGRGGLHDQIQAWCNEQWPKWKTIHCRTDCRSTVAVGVQDFTIFCPGGRLLAIEVKRPGGKRTPEQLAWALELELLGHTVHLVQSMEEFLKLTVSVRL